MAEILMSGATGILKKLVGVVSEDIASAWDVKDDLKKLQSTSKMILAVIADAEKRQEKEELLRLWLRKLKDIAYDADDVIDEVSYEDMRHKVSDLTSSSSSSEPPFRFRWKMAKKIKEINKSLDEITIDIGRFRLEITTPIPDGESTEQLVRQYTSHVRESEIVGREHDESQIIKLLTTNTQSSSSSSFVNPNQYLENISVISIVGMGGLGKTTLAQLVYKDEVVKEVFDLTMWVHVSQNFDIEIILVNIMESITESKFDMLSNFFVLVKKVQEKLSGKKYLLVLDDVWNEDLEQWRSLMSVLLAGASGSKILVTTRDHQVASVVRGSIPPYNLDQLKDDDCWSIIKQKAFSPGGALNVPEMSDIGKEIAKKCCGLPLAANFLGSLMRLKDKESDWISIRDDNIWISPESKRNILPVLKLSYNHLPSHLKQCFSYCAIFPKNWEISKETLIQLWIAEGFLKSSDLRNRKSIEDFGNEYFESLVLRSFFHDLKKNQLGDIMTCKMHDLVHDLAEDVLGENESVSLKISEFKDVSEARRLQLHLNENMSATFMKSLSNAKKLRTLFIPEASKLDLSIFSENNHLRILHMGRSPNYALQKWPSLSFKMRHLRYLRLTSLNLQEAVYDQSISNLYSLETLVLNHIGFGVEILLTNIQSLKKLRYLEVSWSKMVKLPDSVTSLCNLQTLDLNNCKLKFIPESISGLKNLRSLNLSSNPIEALPVSIITLSNLQTLDVNTCKFLKELPKCVADLGNLEIFNFSNCSLLKILPHDLGALNQLRYLDLRFTQIKVLPESCTNLNNLEYVNLFDCEVPKEVTNWIRLRGFVYRSDETPSGIGKLVWLQRLTYSVPEKVIKEQAECNDGIEELANLNSLEVLHICRLQNLKDPREAERANLKGKQNLRGLILSWGVLKGEMSTRWWDQCNFQVIELLQPHTGLGRLTLQNYMGCDLPTWMFVSPGLPNLVELELRKCWEIKELSALIGQLPCLRTLIIIGSKYLTEIPCFPSLNHLKLEQVDHKLVCSVGRSQTSLIKLLLGNINELVYFPISILQKNCNLEVLSIRNCSKLEGFGVNGDENCNQFQGFQVNDDDENDNKVALLGSDVYSGSLRSLHLYDCPFLKFLPGLRGWTSLRSLIIFNCPRVEESLTYDLKSLSFLDKLFVDFIQRNDKRGDPSAANDMINLMKK